MKPIGWILLFFSFLLGSLAQAKTPTFYIKNGVLDLRSWDPVTAPKFLVKGDAEFFWKKFIRADGMDAASRSFIEFPGAWNLNADFPNHGYASIRIRILLPETESVSLQWTWVWTAVEIYVNGQLHYKNGQIGRDPDSAIPGRIKPWIGDLKARNGEVELVMQMSNFDLFLGGHVDVITMGTSTAILQAHDDKQMIDAFLMGSIFIMAIYHITLFVLRRQDRSTLYFGLFCLLVGAHMSAGSRSVLVANFMDISFREHILLYNFTWMMSIPCFGLFICALFPDEFALLVNRVLIGVCACFLIFLGSTEVRTFIWSTQIYQLVGFFGIFYAFYVVGRAAKNRRSGAWTFMVSILMLAAGSINDMLMIRGFLNTLPLAATGLFLFIFGQSYLLSVRFSRAFTRAESSEARVRKLAEDLQEQNNQIRELNETLESRVEEQTREIRSIMEHTPIAIFAIEGSEATIHRDYSLRLEQIIDEKHLAGRAILPLLFAGSSLSPDELDQLTQSLRTMIDEPAMAFDLNEQKLPKTFTRHSKQGKFQQFEAVWNPVMNEFGNIDKILVALTDVTEVRHLESAARERAEELQTIGEILAVRDDIFQRFLRSCKNFNQQNRLLLQDADPRIRDRELIKVVFMNMHTMKGSARTLRFKKLTELFHDLESYYSHLARQDQDSWDLPLMMRDIAMIDSTLQDYEKIAVDKLGRKLGADPTTVLPNQMALEGFQELHQIAEHHKLGPGLRALYAALQATLYAPLATLMQDIFQDVRGLAKDLDKPNPQVILQIPYILIRQESEELLRNIFVHLLRNALDHGIESAAERTSKGKPAAGLIQLTGRVDKDYVILWLNDDGRGLNLLRLMALGRERNLTADTTHTDALACADLIFEDGISTAQTVTTISGRGMGMAAVRSYIQEAGGRIQIELKQDQPFLDEAAPFRLRLELPRSLFSDQRELDQELERSA